MTDFLLTTLDRFVLLGLLPKEGNLLTLRIVRETQDKLSFSEDEVKALNMRAAPNGGSQFDGIPDKAVTLGAATLDIIVKAFKQLDETGKLTLDQVGTFDKFITPKAALTLEA